MSAFLTSVFLLHRQSLMGTAFRIVRDRQAAEDVAQEAYIRTRKAIDAGPIDQIEAFLHQTARNLALDYVRRRKTRANYEEAATEDTVNNVPADVQNAETALIEQERLRCFERALSQLPERARQAWALAELEGWSYAQIAAHLGISRNTVFNDVKLVVGHCHDAIRRAERD